MKNNGKNLENGTSIASYNHVDILKKMGEGLSTTKEPPQFQIHELAKLIGSDEKEVQRSLYILEGQKFVSPNPPGDFTSKVWSITNNGIAALRNLKSSAQAA